MGLIYTGIGGLGHFGTSKTYIVEGGNWIRINTPVASRLYTNDPQLSYYADRRDVQIPIPTKKRKQQLHDLTQLDWRDFDYLAIKLGRHDIELRQPIVDYLGVSPLKDFRNRRGAMLMVFKVPQRQ